MRLISFVISPTHTAATVPSRTPLIPPANNNPRIQEHTTSVTSKITYILPNLIGLTWQIASTSPSPASVITFDRTSIHTPVPTSLLRFSHPHWRPVCFLFCVPVLFLLSLPCSFLSLCCKKQPWSPRAVCNSILFFILLSVCGFPEKQWIQLL